MNSVRTEQILPGEPGYVDYRNPAPPEPARAIHREATPAEDRIVLHAIGEQVETLLRELRRKPAPPPERVAEIDAALKGKVPALLGQVVAERRRKTGVDRGHSDQFETVKEARSKLLGITLAGNHEELVTRCSEGLALFRSEAENESAKV